MLSTMRPKAYLEVISEQANPAADAIEWRDADTLLTLESVKGNTSRVAGKFVRNYLRDYYSSVGSVPWQNEAVLKHVSRQTNNNCNMTITSYNITLAKK